MIWCVSGLDCIWRCYRMRKQNHVPDIWSDRLLERIMIHADMAHLLIHVIKP